MTSSIPPAAEPAPPSDRLWLRSELMGTQVITRDTGRRLGVVGEVVVDIDRREVVALGLRDNPLTRFLPGLPRWMPLDRIRQVGDVILVDSVDSLAEAFQPERYSKVINCQVITESGAQLGRVLGYSFDIETGELTTLVIGALGVPLLGEGVLSTWEMPVGEVVSSGPDRIIVYEGAEEKLKQLGTGLLEKLGIGGASWEQEERERFRSGAVPAENQLPAGQPSALEQRRIQPASSRSFQPAEELEYVELEERREREPLRQRRYLDDDPVEPRQRPARRLADDGYDRDPYERDPDERDRDDVDPYARESDDQSPYPQGREASARFPERSDVRRSEVPRSPEPRNEEPRSREPRDDEPRSLEPPSLEPRRMERFSEEPRSEGRSRDRLADTTGGWPDDPLGEPPHERKPLRAERPSMPSTTPEAIELVDVEPEILEDPW